MAGIRRRVYATRTFTPLVTHRSHAPGRLPALRTAIREADERRAGNRSIRIPTASAVSVSVSTGAFMTSISKRFAACLCVLMLSMLPVSASAEMRITEYMYGGANGEFVELTNVGANP